MSTGTERELHEKAEAFLGTLEIGAQEFGDLGGRNTQTGHLIVIHAVRYLGGWNYRYRVDGNTCGRDDVLALLRGEGAPSVEKH